MPLFNGIYPAMVTPMTEDGRTVSLDPIRPLCDFLMERGANGVFVCGTTGEGPLLTSEEKLSIIEAAVKAVNGRGQIIAQAACANSTGTIKTARIASKMGISAVSLLQPWFYECDEEAQYQYVARVAEALDGFPLYLYNIPSNSGNNLSEATLTRLLSGFPNILGIKESGTVQNIDTWLRHQCDRFQVVCGMDSEIAATLQKGGTAMVSSTANVQSPVFASLFEAARRGDWEQAFARQEQVTRILGAIGTTNLIAGVKEFFRLKGINLGGMRMPLRNLSAEEKARVKQGLEELDLLK